MSRKVISLALIVLISFGGLAVAVLTHNMSVNMPVDPATNEITPARQQSITDVNCDSHVWRDVTQSNPWEDAFTLLTGDTILPLDKQKILILMRGAARLEDYPTLNKWIYVLTNYDTEGTTLLVLHSFENAIHYDTSDNGHTVLLFAWWKIIYAIHDPAAMEALVEFSVHSPYCDGWVAEAVCSMISENTVLAVPLINKRWSTADDRERRFIIGLLQWCGSPLNPEMSAFIQSRRRSRDLEEREWAQR